MKTFEIEALSSRPSRLEASDGWRLMAKVESTSALTGTPRILSTTKQAAMAYVVQATQAPNTRETPPPPQSRANPLTLTNPEHNESEVQNPFVSQC